jgi:predicted DNA-binding transcriptional regulator AlpA
LSAQTDTQRPRPLATDDDFCAYAGITKGQSAQLRYMGRGPNFVKLTGRQVRYRWSDIEKWVESRTRSRTNGPGAA